MFLKVICIWLFVSGLGAASEAVCLRSGFCLQADGHTQTGNIYQFRVGSGEIEFQSSDIASIEANPDLKPIPARTSAKTDEPRSTKRIVEQAAAAEGLDPDFVRSVATIESAFRQDALSKKGAMGLMQLMPSTARGLGVDPRLPTENALGGAKYLRSLLLKYHSNSALALAAYNAGPGAVQRFGGIPPYAETVNYIRTVTREYDRLHRTGHPAKSKVE